ncbi:unnamed protein product [Prorocentrum cordatum]|uniref:Uncharacterized protein n=1 Tax=Prorocentrum cordatum TaxID=2364126 RepID=A0ABN9QTM5_9DINO|nr:unnamed protein product [Polarella glacialis]
MPPARFATQDTSGGGPSGEGTSSKNAGDSYCPRPRVLGRGPGEAAEPAGGEPGDEEAGGRRGADPALQGPRWSRLRTRGPPVVLRCASVCCTWCCFLCVPLEGCARRCCSNRSLGAGLLVLLLGALPLLTGQPCSSSHLPAEVLRPRGRRPDAVHRRGGQGFHPMRLVRTSWLVQQCGTVLKRRQELPEETFVSAGELRAVWDDGERGGRDKVAPIIAISFC